MLPGMGWGGHQALASLAAPFRLHCAQSTGSLGHRGGSFSMGVVLDSSATCSGRLAGGGSCPQSPQPPVGTPRLVPSDASSQGQLRAPCCLSGLQFHLLFKTYFPFSPTRKGDLLCPCPPYPAPQFPSVCPGCPEVDLEGSLWLHEAEHCACGVLGAGWEPLEVGRRADSRTASSCRSTMLPWHRGCGVAGGRERGRCSCPSPPWP